MAERQKKAKAGPTGLIVESDPKSPAAEAYRSLRTNIQFAGLDQSVRSIVVTSSTSGEGKTTTVANFGVAAAQAGARVCIVDADLRRPALHRLFGMENTKGLTTSLVQELPFLSVAQTTRTPNLFLVTSGPLPPNPAELVGSNRMRDMLQAATKDFDLVICDSPPIVSVADAVALAAQCDGVILIVRAGTVPQEVVGRAAEQIHAVKGRILGVVLNGVNLRRDAHYYDYYRYYQSYYGGDKRR